MYTFEAPIVAGPATYDDVDVRIFQEGPPESRTYYAVLTTPNGSVTSSLPDIPEQEWLAIDDPLIYGTELFNWLFVPGSPLELAFLQARWQAESTGRSMAANVRLRLTLDPESILLHGIWWEAMYDPKRAVPIGLSTALSRYVADDGWRVWPVTERPLSMLFVILNPSGLEKFDCKPIEAQLENSLLQTATRGLGPTLITNQLVNPTADQLAAELRTKRPHILYLLGHAVYEGLAASLLIADENGEAKKIAFEDVTKIIAPSPKEACHLVFLNLPRTATVDYIHSLSGLGFGLANAGVQATVALQARIPEEEIIQFSTHFFEVLCRRGVVDEAVMAARGRIYQPGKHWSWTYPVLYMRSPDAVLFRPLPPDLELGLRNLTAQFG